MKRCAPWSARHRPRKSCSHAVTTDAINLVAQSMASLLKPGDGNSDHGNGSTTPISSPGRCCANAPAPRSSPPGVTPAGELDLDDFHGKLSARTRIMAVSHVSNALGTINPVADLIRAARGYGAWTLIDGAQAVQHLPIDVRQLGCDFYAFSGHKMFWPDRYRCPVRQGGTAKRHAPPTRAAAR